MKWGLFLAALSACGETSAEGERGPWLRSGGLSENHHVGKLGGDGSLLENYEGEIALSACEGDEWIPTYDAWLMNVFQING